MRHPQTILDDTSQDHHCSRRQTTTVIKTADRLKDPLQYLDQNSEGIFRDEIDRSSDGDEPDCGEECYMNGNSDSFSKNGNRKSYCPYCSKPQMKLSRHLLRTHQNEHKIEEIVKLPKLSLSRKKLLEKLRIFGNYLHNKKVLQSGKGELLHSFKLRNMVCLSDYDICEICLGLFLKNQKENHHKVCSENSDVDFSSYYGIGIIGETFLQEDLDMILKPKEKMYAENSSVMEESETNVDAVADHAHFILGLPGNDQDDFQIHSGNHFLSSFLSPELRSIRPINDDLGLNLAAMTNGDGRKNYCPYCLKPSVKLNRHILSKHSVEERVQELLKYSKFSDERKRIYEELRVQGNLQYNITALTTGRKEALTTASFNSDLSKITICSKCNLFIKTSSMKEYSCKCETDIKDATTSTDIANSSIIKPRRHNNRNPGWGKLTQKRMSVSRRNKDYPIKIQKLLKTEEDEGSSLNKNGDKVSGKKNYCLYCGQLCAKVVRHFASKHKDESEVQELLALDPRSEERLTKASAMRQRGNLVHNLENSKTDKKSLVTKRKSVLKIDEKDPIVKKRRNKPKCKEGRQDYVPCAHCQSLIKKNLLYKHIQKCTSVEVQDKGLKELLHCGLSLLPVSPEVKKLFKVEVLDTMIKDDLAMIIHDDKLIRDYGEHMFAPGRKKSTLLSLKRKLRLLAKFLEQIMERDSDVESLKQILHPFYFREVLACAKKMYKYCPKTETFQNAFSSYYVAQGLKFCAEFHQQDLIANSKCDSSIKEFIKLFDAQFYNKVSRKPPKAEASFEYVPTDHPYIQVAEDVLQIYEYMDSESLTLRTKLKIDPTPEEFLTHMKSTLSSLAIVNSSLKRVIESLTVNDYERLTEPSKSKCGETPDDILHRELYKITKQDNKGKNITIYFTKDHKHALDLSLELREVIGVNEDNKFLFPRVYHSSLFCLKASICLKEYTKLADLKKADLFLSSEMEKHISRMFTVLHVSEHVHKDLQNFLNIHGKVQCTSFEAKSPNLMTYFVHTCESMEDPSVAGICNSVIIEAKEEESENKDESKIEKEGSEITNENSKTKKEKSGDDEVGDLKINDTMEIEEKEFGTNNEMKIEEDRLEESSVCQIDKSDDTGSPNPKLSSDT